ncbi:hypothetical protein L6452_33866 [Arctium lappa]|uniref:Uncharacterized protein n=1 Tax=Arctium lappa TaxID=4217 RepID=A0ACB8YHA0_ARCLA|nr:hypothetical protein L6452_33866 [Arctium lappa]
MGSATDTIDSSSDASVIPNSISGTVQINDTDRANINTESEVPSSHFNSVGTSDKKCGLKGKGAQSGINEFWKGKMSMRMIKEKARRKHGSKSIAKEGAGNRKKSSKKDHLIPSHSGDSGNHNQFSDSLSTHNSEKAKYVRIQIGFKWDNSENAGCNPR